MEGWRVVFKTHRPRGLDNYVHDLMGTMGTIVFVNTMTPMTGIRCDVDGRVWTFLPDDYKTAEEES